MRRRVGGGGGERQTDRQTDRQTEEAEEEKWTILFIPHL